MYRVLFLFLTAALNTACSSDDSEPIIYCSATAETTDLVQTIPKYIYATEQTPDACYVHGLEVIERRNSYTDDYIYSGCSAAVAEQSQPAYFQSYRMDTIDSKFIHNLEDLNASEVTELITLVCSREFGDSHFEIQSLENFEVVGKNLQVEYVKNDLLHFRSITPVLDSGFNCPLYSMKCQTTTAPRVPNTD